jgi:RND family efflux transporter MFP subunit
MNVIDAIKQRTGLLLLASLALGVGAYEWHKLRRGEGVIPAAEAKPAVEVERILAEGRVGAYPGAEITLGAELSGRLLSLAVKEKDTVEKGQVIAELDVKEQRAALNEAWARVREAQADIDYFELEEGRSDQLFSQNVVAKAARDRSAHDTRSARGRKTSLQASAARLGVVLEKAKLVAPIDGTITARFADEGEMLAAGAPLVTIVDLSRLRVEAEVGEFDAARVKVGAPVEIRAEGHAGAHWSGVIEEIPDQVVPRQLKPLDPARPVDTRVLLVKIELREPLPLKLGQRVEVEIARH